MKLLHGDCYELLDTLPSDSVDLVATDPPYDLENHGHGNTCLTHISKIADGLRHIENSYDIPLFLEKIGRVLRKYNAFIFCSNSQISELMSWGEQRGFITTLLIWHKTNAVPFANGVWRPDVEFIVHIRERKATFNGDATLKTRVDSIPTVVSKWGHPTEKPLRLLRKYITIGSNEGDTVLDPFAGTGTAGAGALGLKRDFIGMELYPKPHEPISENNPDYFGILQRRIATVTPEPIVGYVRPQLALGMGW
jgi:site-specific DNA-methyltransferase (adenine-specific)